MANKKQQTKKDTKTTKRAVKVVKTAKSVKPKASKKQSKTSTVKKENTNSKRHFSIIYKGVKLSSTPSGKRPKQAANKALTAIFNTMDEKERKDYIDNGKEVYFDLYENGRKKKNAKGLRRIFRYTGMRVNTCDYCLNVEFCDDCKKKIQSLVKLVKPDDVKDIKIDKTKSKEEKFVIKNLKLYKRYNYCKSKGWKLPELTKFIEDNKKVYDAIIGCKKCKTTNIQINHLVVKHCPDCLKMIDELHKSDENITKKQVIKNIKILKDYLDNKDDISKQPNLSEHIKANSDKYKQIINCSKCEKVDSAIGYKYTNIVRKSTEEDLKHVGTLITSEEIDKIEEKIKEENKKEEQKKDETKKEVKKITKKEEQKKEEEPKKEVKKTVRKAPAKKQ